MSIRPLTIVLMTALGLAWSMGALAGIAPKHVTVFKLGRNTVTSSLVVRGDRVTIERRYQKPHQGGAPGVGFRTVDRAIYTFDCQGRRVALQNFNVISPREKSVYQAKNLDWFPATGAEMAIVFKDHCAIDLPDTKTPMHPDDWLSIKAPPEVLSAVDIGDQALPPLAKLLNQSEGELTIGQASETRAGLKQVPVTLRYHEPVDLIPGLPARRRFDARLLVDCKAGRMIVADVRLTGDAVPMMTAFVTDPADDLSLWLPLPKTSEIARTCETFIDAL